MKKMLVSRIRNRVKMTCKNFKSDCHFSLYYASLRIVDDFGYKLRMSKLSDRAHKAKDKWILKYLFEELDCIIQKYKEDDYIGVQQENAPIWICWWTGEDTAPELVKQCIKSIYANAGAHSVHMITQESYRQYLDIPQFILDKVNDRTMCIANFSDYLRVSLLEKYGGLWLDATIFCSRKIPEEYFETSLFTCKSEPQESRYISQFRWTAFCLGGWRNHVFYRFFKEALECYWKQEKVSIDYLLVDYIIQTAYSHLPIVKQCMDEIPVNNLHRDELQAAMNQRVSAEKFAHVIRETTVLYKLSWREEYSLTTEDGEQSIYSYFLEKEM